MPSERVRPICSNDKRKRAISNAMLLDVMPLPFFLRLALATDPLSHTLTGDIGKDEGMTGSGGFSETALQPPAEGAGACISRSTGSWKPP